MRHVFLLIEIGVDLFLGDFFGLYAAFRNIHAGNPSDGVEDHLSVAVDSPVAVVVPAGEAAAAGAVEVLKSPDEVLRFAIVLGSILVPEIGSRNHVVFGGDGGDERDRVFCEAKGVIPFVVDGNGFFATAADRVIGGCIEISSPFWIYREAGFHEATDGGEVIIFAVLRFLGMHAVVHKEDAGSFFVEFHEAFVLLAVDGVGIAVDDKGGGIIEHRVVFRPAGNNLGLHREVALGVECFGEKEAAGAEFVIARFMGWSAGEEDDALGRSGGDGGEGKFPGRRGVGFEIAEGVLDPVEIVLQDFGIPVGRMVVAEVGIEDAAFAMLVEPGDGIVVFFCNDPGIFLLESVA